MIFNLDLSKQAQEVIFSRKVKKPSHSLLIFSNIHVNQIPYQKHLGMVLQDKLNFVEHLKYTANKVNKSIGYYNLSNKGVNFRNCALSARYTKINLCVISTNNFICKPAVFSIFRLSFLFFYFLPGTYVLKYLVIVNFIFLCVNCMS